MQRQTPSIETRQRSLITLWFALLMSLGLYLLVTLFAMESREESGSKLLSFIFAAVATFTVILSFPLKQRLLRRSVEKQDPSAVQSAFVLAWAMCEVSALLGIVEYSVVGTRDYLVLFLIAAVGMILHFPTRQHLLNASYKNLG
jgi:NADH:ubiquinone oxidoreductase subunit 2 (subunit N)